MRERTFCILKPDAVARGLTGAVVARYEAKGLRIVAMEMRTISPSFAALHYSEHLGKSFYDDLVSFMTSGPLVALVLEGEGAVEAVRTLNGPTNGLVAPPGTLRGDFSLSHRYNLVHGSDSVTSAAAEIQLWFPDVDPI